MSALRARAASAGIGAPRLAAFLDQKPDDRERGHGVDPPGAEGELRQQPDNLHARQPASRFTRPATDHIGFANPSVPRYCVAQTRSSYRRTGKTLSGRSVFRGCILLAMAERVLPRGVAGENMRAKT